MAQAFVTGGSGFIGQVLIRRLVRDGHTVRALVRSDAASSSVVAAGAEAVLGELLDPDTWREAVEGSDVLFNLAALTDLDASHAEQERITVGGARAALEAARTAGVPHFVHCSSEAALLAGPPLVEVDETAPLRPDSAAPYCAAKAQSEQLVLDAGTSDFVTVSIRPRFVWGRHGLLENLVAAARNGQFAWIDGARQTTDITHVDNAVEGLVLGWQRGRTGQAYFVTDEHRVVLRDFLQPVFDMYGVDAPEIDLATAEQTVPIPALWMLGQTCTLRTDKAVAELGYRPVMTLDEGMADLRNALRAEEV